jgi:two-component system response regulator ChvI
LLLERIRSVLRRYEAHTTDNESENVMRRGDLLLDPSRHLCCWKDDEINLTVTEFLIVEALARRPGHVKSRDQLIDAAYGENIYVDDRTIDSHIKRLRRKFKALDDEFSGIDTLYGVGYRYTGI